MNPQQIITALRERQRSYACEAAGHNPTSDGYKTWTERSDLMKAAADYIELVEDARYESLRTSD